MIVEDESPFLIRDTEPNNFNNDLKIDIISPKPFLVDFDKDFTSATRNFKNSTESYNRSKSVFNGNRPSIGKERRASFTKQPLRS